MCGRVVIGREFERVGVGVGGKKSAGAFVLIRYGLEEASEKYSSHAH